MRPEALVRRDAEIFHPKQKAKSTKPRDGVGFHMICTTHSLCMVRSIMIYSNQLIPPGSFEQFVALSS